MIQYGITEIYIQKWPIYVDDLPISQTTYATTPRVHSLALGSCICRLRVKVNEISQYESIHGGRDEIGDTAHRFVQQQFET